MKIDFVQPGDHNGPLHTMEKQLAIDAKAVLPSVGDRVTLPGHRKLRIVESIRWRYGKRGVKCVEVLVRERRLGER